MLSEADATLVQADGEIPALAVVLDPDGFAQTLSRVYPDADVTSVEPRYVRYKPGVSCLVGYSIQTASGRVDAYARAHSAASSDKIAKARQRASVPSSLGQGIRVLSDTALVIYPFPNDHELRALTSLAEPAARRELLGELLPDDPPLWAGKLQTIRYKPERRYVARLLSPGGGSALVKFYTRRDFLGTTGNVVRFSNEPPLRIAPRLSRSRRHRASASEWLEGRPLHEVLKTEGGSAEAWAVVGVALARLHAQKPKRLQMFWTAQRYVASLSDAARAVADVSPDLASRVRSLTEKLGDLFLKRHWRTRRAIHGDFSASQVLLKDRAAVFLDFDRAGYGDPRIDLGMFHARLILEVIGGGLARDQADNAFGELLEAYRHASGKDVTRKLHRFGAASLLQCAIEPFRHRHPDWPEKIDAIIAAAGALAEGGRVGV